MFETDTVRHSRVDPAIGPRALKICGLKPETTEEYIIQLLEPFGQVDAVHLYRNIDNDISHAYVEFRSEFVPETA